MVKGRVTKCAIAAIVLLSVLAACSSSKGASTMRAAIGIGAVVQNTIAQPIDVILPSQRHLNLPPASLASLNNYQEALVRASYARPVRYQYRNLAGDAMNLSEAEIIKNPPTEGSCTPSTGPVATCQVIVGTMQIGRNTQTTAASADDVTTDCTPQPDDIGKFISRWLSAPGYHNSDGEPFQFGKTFHCIGHKQNGQITYRDAM